MSGFGDRLRAERERRNVSLEQVAEATRIGKTYLEALERGDLASLPGGAFNKGYVRAYAEYLGAEAAPLVQAYLEEEAEQSRQGKIDAPAALSDLSRAIDDRLTLGGRRRRVSPLAVSAVAGVLAVALAAGWWLLRSGGADPAIAAADPVPRAEEPAPPVAAPEPRPAPEQPAIEGIAEPAERFEPEPEPATPPAPATPAPETPSAAAAPAVNGLAVTEAGVGTGVVSRRLVGESDRFTAGTRAWFWTRVVGARPGEHIVHVWLHEGREMGRNRLEIGGSHWRTQSRKTLYEGLEGSWAVEARAAGGRVLARREFTVEPRGAGR